MDIILVTVKKSARLLRVEVNLAGEKIHAVLNQGPHEIKSIEKLVYRLLTEKGFQDYTIMDVSALSEGEYKCTIGRIAS